MTDVAITTQNNSTPQTEVGTKAAKPLRIPAKVRHACELIADGNVKTIKAAADRVGLSREHLSKMMSRPHVRVFVAQRAAQNITSATLRASNRLVELIDAESEHVAAKVSERILTSEGILKSDQSSIAVSVDVRAGFVIDLTEPTKPGKPPLTIAGDICSEKSERDQ